MVATFQEPIGVSDPSFAVPIAFSSTGSLVRPDEAKQGERYRCPGCSADVVLRRGERRRAHFAHRGGEGCSAESALHRAAKHEVLRVVEEWKSTGGPRPCVSRPCPRYGCDGGIVQDLPDDVTHALAEVRLSEGMIADVVLYRAGEPAAVVEIVVTSRVDDRKARRFSVPWMELRGTEVLDRPYWWVAEQDGLQPFTCSACEERKESNLSELRVIRGRALELAARLGAALPPSPPYDAVPHHCWRCGAAMLAFVWPTGGRHRVRRPPEPIPESVRCRVTAGGGTHWANCCPSCSAVQGDYYLARDNTDYMVVRDVAEDVYGQLGRSRGGDSP